MQRTRFCCKNNFSAVRTRLNQVLEVGSAVEAPPGARKIISSKKPLDDEDYRRLFDLILMKDYPMLNLKISRSSCGAKKAISVDFNEGKNPYAADFFITPLKAFE